MVALIIAISLLGVLVVLLDWQEMRRVIAQADLRFIPGALFFAAFSYLCVSYAYAYVSQSIGIKMGKRDLAVVCFVTIVVNHVLTAGGLVGYSMRYLLMKMHGVSLKDVLTSSILHFYLTSLDMLGMLPVAFVYLLFHASVPRGVAVILGLMTFLFGVVFVGATGLVFVPSWRGPILDLLVRLGRLILRRDFYPRLAQYNETLTLGAEAMRGHPLVVVWVMVLTMIDFICSVAVLGFCFYAMGSPVQPAVLLCGFVIGIVAGVLSMVPGGFGVQEASMVGIFVLLGVPFQPAFLASVLFRIIYYLLPYFLSLGFYGRLLRQAERQALVDG